MKKIVFVVILICAAFLLIGCQTKGRAVAGQRLWGGWASQEAGQELQMDTGFPSPVTDFRSLEMPVSEVTEKMDCMAAEVTVEAFSTVGSGPNENAARWECIQGLVRAAWNQANDKCAVFRKEDQQTSCRVASGTLNPDKDIVVTDCYGNGGSTQCNCELNKDKDYACNGH